MDRLLNIEESAALLNLSTWTIRAYIRERKLNAVRIGRRILLEPSELENFVNRSKSDIPDPAGER